MFYSLSNITFLITLASSILLLLILRSFNDTLYALDISNFAGPSVSLSGNTAGGARGHGAGSCRMAWMNPSYIPIDGFKSRFNGKYQAYLYREQGWDTETDQPSGSPVLFIPGNAGSFRQVRSIAAATASLYYKEKLAKNQPNFHHSAPNHPGLDFFTLDFNEDFTAFHGETLSEQAEFANDLISHILNIYAISRQRSSLPNPTSVLILAHSMGGIVARKMLFMPNYINGTINTIISLSTPHTIPPITLDRGLETVYQEINKLWREAYWGASWGGDLRDLVMASISGSTSDTTVSPDSSSLLTLSPSLHGLTVYTTSMPEVWTPTDHRAILWCDQLRLVIAKALLFITDPRLPSQVKPKEKRAEILEYYFTNGRGLRITSDDMVTRPLSSYSDAASYKVHPPLSRLKLRSEDLNRRQAFSHVIPLKQKANPEPSSKSFTLLTNLPLGVRLKVVGCHGTFERDTTNSCTLLTTRYSTMLPSSHFKLRPAPIPGPGDDADPHEIFNFIEIPDSAISSYDFLAIITSNAQESLVKSDEPDFLMCEFGSKNAIRTFDHSLWRLSLWGLEFENFSTSNSTLVSDIYFSGMDSSLLAFKIHVTYPSTCLEKGSFAPLMRQQTPILHESKFHPNIQSALLYTHFSTAYTPIPKISTDDVLQSGSGMRLTFWMDPFACSETREDEKMKIRIKVDWYESARKIVVLYRTALVAIPLGIVSASFAIQIQRYRHSGVFPSLGVALSVLSEKYLLGSLVTLISIQLAQSAILRVSWAGQARPGVEQDRPSHTALAITSTWISGLLLGDHHPEFALLDCLMFVIGLGFTCIVYILLNIICTLLTKSMIAILGVSNFKDARNLSGNYRISTPSSRSSLSIQTIVTATLIFFTTFMAPYQFAFLVILLVHFFQTLRALGLAKTNEIRQIRSTDSWNKFHYYLTTLFLMICLAPGNVMVITVWIKNLSIGWYKPFSSDRKIYLVIGYLFWFHRTWSSTGSLSMLPRSKDSLLLKFTMWLSLGTGLFSILYGIRYTFQIFDLLNFVFLCLALLHYTVASDKST
ncbi:PGAP1-like protein-domain-containing protein [Melampsora americana]|nr:PGAP1-like protein-domain-containing protein [Melampsora americana]